MLRARGYHKVFICKSGRIDDQKTERTSTYAEEENPGFFQCRISKNGVIWILLALLFCAFFVIGGVCGTGRCGASNKTTAASSGANPSAPSQGPVATSPNQQSVAPVVAEPSQPFSPTDSPKPTLTETSRPDQQPVAPVVSSFAPIPTPGAPPISPVPTMPVTPPPSPVDAILTPEAPTPSPVTLPPATPRPVPPPTEAPMRDSTPRPVLL